MAREYAAGVDCKVDSLHVAHSRTFDGILRPDGRIATRNYICIISTVNCSASVARLIADGLRGEALTGMVAGGVHVICFTTGRGSVFGCRPVPSIKLASNTAMFNRMQPDMDVNRGVLLEGEQTVAELGQKIFELILQTASGRRTRSECLGIGDSEFVPRQIGAVM